MAEPDVVVVGAGVIGCSVAYALASRGATVRVVERDAIGAHASRAAAGMLTPLTEAALAGGAAQAADSPSLRVGRRSLALYPDLVEELREVGGIDARLTLCGVVAPAAEADQARLRAWAEAPGAEWFGSDDLQKALPGLARGFAGALWVAREGHLEPALLTRAYAAAAVRRGAEFRSGETVGALIREHGRVVGVRTAQATHRAHDVVLCTGAWAAAASEWSGVALPVEPVRGQMVALEPPPPPLPHIVWGPDAYLVPRGDGRLLVGATVERAGFDARPHAAGVAQLLRGALALFPGLARAGFRSTWAGLRPGTPDERPLVGPLAPGLWLAAGHYRTGVLLSAWTGRAVAEPLLGAAPEPDAAAFDPRRFSPGEGESGPAVV